MNAHIISQSDKEVTIQVKVLLKTSMLESEQSILESVNDVGMLATSVALKNLMLMEHLLLSETLNSPPDVKMVKTIKLPTVSRMLIDMFIKLQKVEKSIFH